MKRLWILFLYTVFPLCVIAQQPTEYNKKGDEAMKRLDYRDARLFYSEGIPNCDIYSINQLTTIWIANEPMRASMHNLMNKCLSCLNEKATEGDTIAIAKLILYYTEGIGAPQSEGMAAYWTERLNDATQPAVPEYVAPTLTPPKQPINYFAGYAFTLHSPVGITFGGVGRLFGWYGRLKTNLSFQNYTHEFTGEDPADIPKETLLKGVEKIHNSYALTGGLVVRYEPFYFSLGLGYWQQDWIYRYAELNDGGSEKSAYTFYKKTDASHKGVAADLDCIVEFGRLYVTAGCNLLNYKAYDTAKKRDVLKFAVDLNAGMGIFF
jgi:hypothetical protein